MKDYQPNVATGLGNDEGVHLVIDRRNITSTARVPVPIPGPTDVVPHLVDSEVDSGASLLYIMGKRYTRNACANGNDLYGLELCVNHDGEP